MAFIKTIEQILGNNNTLSFYVNTKQEGYKTHVAKSITIANLTVLPQKIYYLVAPVNSDVPTGAIFWNFTLDAEEVLFPDDKAIPEGYCIRAWAEEDRAVSFVCDIHSL